jgi:hypothetical protein
MEAYCAWGTAKIRQNRWPPKHVLTEKPNVKRYPEYKRIANEAWAYLKEILIHLCIVCLAVSALMFQAALQNIVGSSDISMSAIARDFIIAYSDFVITIRCTIIISRSLLPALLLIESIMDSISKGRRPPPPIY